MTMESERITQVKEHQQHVDRAKEEQESATDQVNNQTTANNNYYKHKKAPVAQQVEHLKPTTLANQSPKTKITHRSQSSPSSLTTHKFGLRPTPSPPRLIIDHQTGDIVESYPEQPVYLRTYQPLDDDEEDEDEEPSQSAQEPLDYSALDYSLSHPYPPPLATGDQRALDEYSRLLASSGQPQQQLGSGEYLSSDEYSSAMVNNRNTTNSRSFIPPPHSAHNKVYFAPPAPSASGGHLFDMSQHPNSDLLYGPDYDHQQNQQLQPYQMPHQMMAPDSAGDTNQQPHRMSGSHNNSFKRALNKLNEVQGPTDIAIVTDLPGSPNSSTGRRPSSGAGSSGNATSGGFKVTATSAARGEALMSKKRQHQQQRAKPRQQMVKAINSNSCNSNNNSKPQQIHRLPQPAIEDFNLYDFCFNLRTILACLISSLIIYLLVVPLTLDCHLYRPTYTYISIIVSSVNLTCIVIFSLFWYCNEVTRTLYANLSSSAFIITIYCILVALNLALAILFFFINTCHFQKLINTARVIAPQPIHHVAAASLEDNNQDLGPMALPVSNSLHFYHQVDDAAGSSLPPHLTSHLIEKRRIGFGESLELRISEIIDSLDERAEARQRGVYLPRTTTRTVATMPTMANNGSSKQLSGERLRVTRQTVRRQQNEQRRARAQESDDSLPPLVLNHDQDGASAGEGSSEIIPFYNEDQLEVVPGGQSHFTGSPLEVAWDYVKKQLALFKRQFHQFLLEYDLKFIGTLHALCAICLQYMAMKVAVVRSYFCSPVGAYC